MGRTSRRKGAEYEVLVAHDLTGAGFPARRALNETRDGNAGDTVFACNAPLSIQARHRKEPSVWDAVRSAEAAAPEGFLPIAFVKRTSAKGRAGQEIVAMPKAAFLRLLALARPALLQERSTASTASP